MQESFGVENVDHHANHSYPPQPHPLTIRTLAVPLATRDAILRGHPKMYLNCASSTQTKSRSSTKGYLEGLAQFLLGRSHRVY